jgi:hypothetical protein
MKKQVIALVVVLAAGVAASFALAAPPPGKGPTTSSSSTSTSPGKSGDHGNKGGKCRPINLKGTVTGGGIQLSVTKASGPKGKSLVGTTANLTVSGKVMVQAWDCSAPGSTAAPQLTLRQLHVGGSPHAPTTTTTP